MTDLTTDNPFTGEPACTVALADAQTVNAVLDRAREVARSWCASGLEQRLTLCERAVASMEAHGETIAADITRMMGKPLAQSHGELKTMAARARHMMSIAG